MADLRPTVRAAIAGVATDIDPSTIDDDAAFHVAAQLDSMDFLAVLSTLADDVGVEVPERDYPRVTTIRALADYLDARRPGG